MRFFDALNTLKAVGIALAAVLVVDVGLFLAVYSPNVEPSAASLPVEGARSVAVLEAPGPPDRSAGEEQYR